LAKSARAKASHREWYLKNREKIIARSAAWAKANPEKVRASQISRYYSDPKRHLEYQRKHRKNNPRKYLFGLARGRARRKGQEFTITMDDLPEIPEKCPLLGLVLNPWSIYLSHHPSLDRIDNSKGYVPGNVQFISHRANMLKNSATVDEMLCLVCNWMEREEVA